MAPPGNGSPDGDTFAILDHRFRIRTTSPGCRVVIERTFGDCRSAFTGAAPTYVLEDNERTKGASAALSLDDEDLVKNASHEAAFSLLAWHVMNNAVAESSGILIVHAGAAVSPSGAAVLLPAGSGRGKTTLVAGLVRAGFSYLSDEIAAFDPGTLRVQPVPRALSVKPGTFEALGVTAPDLPPEAARYVRGTWPLRPADLGSAVASEPALVGAVFVPAYAPGQRTRLDSMSRAAGVAELATNAFNLEAFGGSEGVGLLARVVRSASCYRLSVGSVDEAVEAVRGVVGSS